MISILKNNKNTDRYNYIRIFKFYMENNEADIVILI